MNLRPYFASLVLIACASLLAACSSDDPKGEQQTGGMAGAPDTEHETGGSGGKNSSGGAKPSAGSPSSHAGSPNQSGGSSQGGAPSGKGIVRLSLKAK